MPTSNDSLTIDRFSFALRLDTLFVPFSIEEVTPGLEQLGFSLTEDIERMLTPGAKPMGTRINVDGHIAHKDDPPLQVRVDMGRGVLGVDGKNVDEVIEEYRLIEAWINKELQLNLGGNAKFYESILEGILTVGIERSPIETLKRLYTDGGQISQFSQILGRGVTNFGIRIVTEGTAPMDDTWLDLRIEPSVQRSNSAYRVNVVSRGKQLDTQAEEARQLTDKLSQLVSAMEKVN